MTCFRLQLQMTAMSGMIFIIRIFDFHENIHTMRVLHPRNARVSVKERGSMPINNLNGIILGIRPSIHIHGVLTKREVKKAGYWSFLEVRKLELRRIFNT